MFCTSLLIKDKPPMYNGFHHQQPDQIQLLPYNKIWISKRKGELELNLDAKSKCINFEFIQPADQVCCPCHVSVPVSDTFISA